MGIVIGIIVIVLFTIGKAVSVHDELGANRESKKYYKALNKQMKEEKKAKANKK